MLHPPRLFSPFSLSLLLIATVACGSRTTPTKLLPGRRTSNFLTGNCRRSSPRGIAIKGSGCVHRPDTYDAKAEKQAFDEQSRRSRPGFLVSAADPRS